MRRELSLRQPLSTLTSSVLRPAGRCDTKSAHVCEGLQAYNSGCSTAPSKGRVGIHGNNIGFANSYWHNQDGTIIKFLYDMRINHQPRYL
jgi:hypothetical protein